MYILTPFQNFNFFNLNKLARFQSSKPLFIIQTFLFCKFVQINTQSIHLSPSPSLTHALYPDCLCFICLKNLPVSISTIITISLSLSLSLSLFSKSIFISPPLTFFTWPYFILFLTSSFSALAKPKIFEKNIFFLFKKETQIVLFNYFCCCCLI